MKATKEKYLHEALKLFAASGYEAVGVVDIAAAVNCTTSALYKHFPNKKALFDAAVKRSREEYLREMDNFRKVYAELYGDKSRAMNVTEEDQIRMLHTLIDSLSTENSRLFRKLALIEQDKNNMVPDTYNRNVVIGQVKVAEEMIKLWIDAGVIMSGDPLVLAMEYISPIILGVEMIDREPDKKDEVVRMMEIHVRQFHRSFRVQNEKESK